MTPADRRHFIAGAGAAAAAVGLAACGADDSADTQPGATTNAPASTAPQSSAAETSAAETSAAESSAPAATSAAAPEGPSAAKADVPVGGGTVLTADHVVIVQPTSGVYKGYTSICTHQGCDVSKVENNLIICECHNSQFSAEDGSVKSGEASAPLASKTVVESGDNLVVTG